MKRTDDHCIFFDLGSDWDFSNIYSVFNTGERSEPEDIDYKNMVPTDHDIPFSRTFEVHFQGVFKDFSLFFQTSIREKMTNNGLFK